MQFLQLSVDKLGGKIQSKKLLEVVSSLPFSSYQTPSSISKQLFYTNADTQLLHHHFMLKHQMDTFLYHCVQCPTLPLSGHSGSYNFALYNIRRAFRCYIKRC